MAGPTRLELATFPRFTGDVLTLLNVMVDQSLNKHPGVLLFAGLFPADSFRAGGVFFLIDEFPWSAVFGVAATAMIVAIQSVFEIGGLSQVIAIVFL